jgi:hypothetical protein
MRRNSKNKKLFTIQEQQFTFGILASDKHLTQVSVLIYPQICPPIAVFDILLLDVQLWFLTKFALCK